MTISYNLNIPDGPNNPSNDQPKMKVNTNAIDAWTAIDHVKFDTSPAGTHKQVTFSSKNAAGAQVDPQSVLYTGNGTAFSSIAQMYFRNQSGIVPVNMIRAFGSFLTNPGNTTQINGYNFTFLVNGLGTVATVTLTSGITTGTNFIVVPFLDSIIASSFSYTIAANTINFSMSAASAGSLLSFIVLQI